MASRGPFREVQRLPHRRTALMLAIPPAVMLGLLIWQVVLGRTWGRQPMSNASVILWTVFLWIVYLRLIRVRLVTEIRGGELVIAMQGLWRSRRVRISGISSAETIGLDAKREYGGYGIRTVREGKAYLANARRGVRLRLSDGSMLVVSSQKPDELIRSLGQPAARDSSLR